VTRIRIDPKVATEVLFLSNRTCCVCREPGKPFRIHHIDENPANNDPENFAVLCFDCHDKTQVRGGFGRGLDAAQVTQFRDDWLQRIQRRRDQADRIAAEGMAGAPGAIEVTEGTLEARVSEAVGVSESVSTATAEGKTIERLRVPIEAYVLTIAEQRRRAYDAARPDCDSGVTARMVEGSCRVIDVMQEILVALAGYCPAGHFDTESPKDYISALIATRYRWHRYHFEPHGHGQNGTINVMVAGATMADAKRMITDMVLSLMDEWPGFVAWRTEWERK
jgi:hypothetical protein